MATNPIMTADNFQDLYDPKWSSVFFLTWGTLPEEYRQFMTVKSSTRHAEYDHHVAGLGVWKEKAPSGPIEYESINMGASVTYLHKAYGMGAQVERELVDDERYDIIAKLPKALAIGAEVVVEQVSIDVLNTGFSRVGYDGVPLFSASHPLYGNLGGTCSNLVSDTLSLTGIKNAISAGRAQVSDSGIKEPAFRGKVDLYYPTGLDWKVLEMTETPTTPYSNESTKNVVAGKIGRKIPLTYLTDPDHWFIKDPSAPDDTLVFWWRVAAETKKTQVFDTGVYKWGGYERFGCGYSNWRGWVGANP